jgi:WG containing repeat
MKKLLLFLLFSPFFSFSQNSGLYGVELSNVSKNDVLASNEFENIRYGLIDSKGELKKELDFGSYWGFVNTSNEGLLVVHQYNKLNYRNGRIIILNSNLDTLNKFDNVSPERLSNGFQPKEYLVKLIKEENGIELNSIIGNDGNVLIEFSQKNKNLEYVGEDYFSRINKKNIELINSSGEVVQSFFSANFVTAQQKRYNVQPKVRLNEGLIPFVYNENERGWTGIPNGKWGFIDIFNNIIIKPQYESVKDFSDGLALVSDSEDNWFFIDKIGNKCFGLDFSSPKSFYCKFSEGLIPVVDKKTQRLGYLNSKGAYFLPPKYLFASVFSDGLAQVSLDGVHFSIINSKGEEILNNIWRRSDYNTITWNKHLIADKYLGRYFTPSGKLVWEDPDKAVLLFNTKQINTIVKPYHIKRVTGFYCVTESEKSQKPFLFKSIQKFQNISYLYSSGIIFENSRSNFLELYKLKNIKLLSLESKITVLPDGISNLQKLEYLALDNTEIETLPSDLYKIKTLKQISLVGNKLKSLPKNFLLLPKDVRLIIRGSEIAKDKEILNQLLHHFKSVDYQSYDMGIPNEMPVQEKDEN